MYRHIGIYHLYTSLQTFNALIDCPVKYKFLAKHTNKKHVLCVIWEKGIPNQYAYCWSFILG